MPGAIWTGTISFGLVTVPVRMVSATRDLDVHFHQIDAETRERIEIRRVCAQDEQEVAWEEIGRGYELDGQLVTLTDEELASAAPQRTHTIEIEEFVDAGAIDPAQLDKPYFLLPDSDAEAVTRAYRLLRDAMARSDRVAIGHVVLRSNEYLVALRERDGLLALTTMFFADEIRDASEIGAVPAGDAASVSPAEVTTAVQLVDALSQDFDPARYEDRNRERLLALIHSKQKSKKAKPKPAQEPAAPQPVPDLMAALKRSLERARQ